MRCEQAWVAYIDVFLGDFFAVLPYSKFEKDTTENQMDFTKIWECIL